MLATAGTVTKSSAAKPTSRPAASCGIARPGTRRALCPRTRAAMSSTTERAKTAQAIQATTPMNAEGNGAVVRSGQR
jgi:hypothetical protein